MFRQWFRCLVGPATPNVENGPVTDKALKGCSTPPVGAAMSRRASIRSRHRGHLGRQVRMAASRKAKFDRERHLLGRKAVAGNAPIFRNPFSGRWLRGGSAGTRTRDLSITYHFDFRRRPKTFVVWTFPWPYLRRDLGRCHQASTPSQRTGLGSGLARPSPVTAFPDFDTCFHSQFPGQAPM